MINKLKEIVSGWVNVAWDQFDLLDENIKKEGERRASSCDTCPLRVSNSCDSTNAGEAIVDFMYGNEQRYKGTFYTGCGCNLRAKVISPTSQCPLGKWEQPVKLPDNEDNRITDSQQSIQ